MKLRNYLLLSISTILLASCSSEAITNDTPAEERIPLRLQATLSANRPVTRAVGNEFADDDEIISYVQHVVTENETVNSVTAKTIKFTTQTATAAYWDDFSESSDASTDLRTANHGLRSYYGYCYNGGTPSTALVETTGVLGWTIAADQTKGIKQYDLLWSKTTGAVTYDHAKDNRGTLSVPFTHAMSKFTIVVVAGDGFENDDLTTATVKLFGMNSTGTFTAPTATVVPAESTTVNIDMYGNAASTTDHSRAFEAIAIPQSDLSENKHFATITMAGNTYKVIITSGMLTSWNDGITDSKSKSNYNYKLTVKLNKQAVDVKATLANWTDVSATGNGDIAFNNDIVNFTVDNPGNEFADGSSFNLYWKKSTATDYTLATKSTLTSGIWINATATYWPNGTDSYYFRALTGNTNDFDVKQGEDVLWGTTAKHSTYNVGDAIAPRTGVVPLIFEHAMSKIAFDLTTSDGDDKVELDDAIISISNLYTDGTISIADGDILRNTSTEAAISDLKENTAVIVLPQTISKDAIVTITLKDGSTKYKIQLNTCTAGTTPITAWERGKSYTYTITVKKEAVQFRALIQDWNPATGSGQANLDWD